MRIKITLQCDYMNYNNDHFNSYFIVSSILQIYCKKRINNFFILLFVNYCYLSAYTSGYIYYLRLSNYLCIRLEHITLLISYFVRIVRFECMIDVESLIKNKSYKILRYFIFEVNLFYYLPT